MGGGARRALRPLPAAALVCAALLAGCGLGPGGERTGDGAELRVTRDFGRVPMGSVELREVREGQTVMRALRSAFDVETRYGGRFVQAIEGLAGGGPGGSRDWFFFVNGLESGTGAADRELSPGDVVQWDYRRWDAAMHVPAIVGAFPEPLEHGVGGRRLPVRVECEDPGSTACATAERRLRAAGVAAGSATLGAPGTQNVIRVVVARWRAARRVSGALALEEGPGSGGVFARFSADGRSLALLDRRGEVVRRAGPGDGTGVVAAVRPSEEEIVWLVTGVDRAGVRAAARALRAGALRDAFAVAASAEGIEKLPLEGVR